MYSISKQSVASSILGRCSWFRILKLEYIITVLQIAHKSSVGLFDNIRWMKSIIASVLILLHKTTWLSWSNNMHRLKKVNCNKFWPLIKLHYLCTKWSTSIMNITVRNTNLHLAVNWYTEISFWLTYSIRKVGICCAGHLFCCKKSIILCEWCYETRCFTVS